MGFREDVRELEKIALGPCRCDTPGPGRCKVCKASSALNVLAADAKSYVDEVRRSA